MAINQQVKKNCRQSGWKARQLRGNSGQNSDEDNSKKAKKRMQKIF